MKLIPKNKIEVKKGKVNYFLFLNFLVFTNKSHKFCGSTKLHKILWIGRSQMLVYYVNISQYIESLVEIIFYKLN